MDGKWRTLRSEPVFRDQWLDVRADTCVTPDGVEISPYYVLRYPDWVNIVAVTPDDRLVLVRQYRHAVGEMVLEVPGGAVDAGDGDLEQAARRELEEETGYTATDWVRISSLYPNPATHTNRIHGFLATGAVRRSEQALEAGEEGMQVCTMPIEAVLAGIRGGLIGQAMQVPSVLLGLAMLGRRLVP